MKTVRIDRKKRLREEPHTGHNRWHPDIPAIVEVAPGEDVALETRDANDLQIGPHTVASDLEKLQRNIAHPLTGPVYVKGAKPGDLLEIEYLDIVPEKYGWTRFAPNGAFLPELFDYHFVAHWDITPQYASSPQLPGVRIPNGAFMGTAGLAPSHEQLKKWAAREAELKARGGRVWPPDPENAFPPSVGSAGLRTIPPRENCGNADIKQLTKGSRLFIPVAVDGGLYSAGDAHFAQGDSECCGTAIEMGATCVVRCPAHRLAALLASRLLPAAGDRRAAQLHRHDGHAHHARGEERELRPLARREERGHQHDRAPPGARLDEGAGLRHLQRRGGSAREQRGRCPQRDGQRAAAGGHFPKINADRHHS